VDERTGYGVANRPTGIATAKATAPRALGRAARPSRGTFEVSARPPGLRAMLEVPESDLEVDRVLLAAVGPHRLVV